jgi:hypothetical protein
MFGQTARGPAGEEFVNTAEYRRDETCLADHSYKFDIRMSIRFTTQDFSKNSGDIKSEH